jgi:hypothetical protein
MLDTTGEGSREGLRIGDPSGDITASVRLIAVFEPINPVSALVWIELGGILQVLYPALVHFLGDPAIVADMRVPVPLVERGEYTLHLGRTAACNRQPGTFQVVLVKVFRGVFDADVWQAGPARLETHESHVPLKIGGVLGAAARLDQLPGRPGVVAGVGSGRFSRSGSSGPLRISATLQYCR